MRARRSCLSVPGSSERMLAKAAALPADEIVIDLEDAVAVSAKDVARELVARRLADGALGDAAVAVRVNALATPWGERDVHELARCCGPRIGSLVVPKAESAQHVHAVAALLDDAGEGAAGVGLQLLVETAAGLVRAAELAAASPRVEALIIGYADLAASLGRGAAAPSPPGSPGGSSTSRRTPADWLFAQETVLVAARAAGVQAIDGPYLEIRDEDGLAVRAAHARALGYDGKWAVHPGQLDAINAAFTPSGAEVERARSVIDALAAGDGRGAVELDGEMLDEASRRLALQVLARAGIETREGRRP